MGARMFQPGGGQNKRSVDVVLNVAVLRPRIVLPELPTMVAPQDDDGICTQTEAVQFVEQFADLGVDVTHRGVVAVLEFAGEVVGNMSLGNAVISSQFYPR